MGWDPNKDPTIPVGQDGGYYRFSAPPLQEKLAFCAEQARAPVALYKSLEFLTKRTGLFKRGILGPGPGANKLARAIMETKTALDKVVVDLLNQLSSLAMLLDVTINILDKEKHDIIRGRSLDHLDSVTNKIERLLSLRERLGKRLERIARQGAIGLTKYGYKSKQTIILYADSGPEILCTKNGQIFGREGAGNLPDRNMLPGTTSDRKVPTDASHSSMCASLQHAAAVTTNKGSGESDLVSPPMVEYVDKG